GCTELLRRKESNDEYRYLPEPDLPPLVLTESFVERIEQAAAAAEATMSSADDGEDEDTAANSVETLLDHEGGAEMLACAVAMAEQQTPAPLDRTALANWLWHRVPALLRRLGAESA